MNPELDTTRVPSTPELAIVKVPVSSVVVRNRRFGESNSTTAFVIGEPDESVTTPEKLPGR
jgi:hypothetical protein